MVNPINWDSSQAEHTVTSDACALAAFDHGVRGTAPPVL